jgi:hypothetical protein
VNASTVAWSAEAIPKLQLKYNEAQRQLERAEAVMLAGEQVRIVVFLSRSLYFLRHFHVAAPPSIAYSQLQRPSKRRGCFGMCGRKVDAVDYWTER